MLGTMNSISSKTTEDEPSSSDTFFAFSHSVSPNKFHSLLFVTGPSLSRSTCLTQFTFQWISLLSFSRSTPVDSALALQYIPHVLPLSFRNERSNFATVRWDSLAPQTWLWSSALSQCNKTKTEIRNNSVHRGQINKTLVPKSKTDLCFCILSLNMCIMKACFMLEYVSPSVSSRALSLNALNTFVSLLCSYRAYWIINVHYIPTCAQICSVNLY